ncbi:VWA domain-containing protein [Tessaracoccus caeni]|uniref:VWA domain-containing protein n=1 Tax=Tessaracoccus caeni TaxID=3031239 RepID=UPI0023DA969F|nr:VWA domain-containing protein [Tessaracoccus caeni]MDF1490200.1 VWA domain-containing protein [Tessaracoccus caeni]
MSWIPEFLSPDRLWSLLVLPLLIIAYLIVLRLKGRVSMRYTNTGVLGRVVGSQRQWTRHLAVAMSLCSLFALGMAWAQPLGVSKEPRERATVVMVVDTSRSMAAADVEPDRLTAAKAKAKEYIESLPPGFNVALVNLSATPSIKMPPSTDRGAIGRALDALDFEDGTALGSAIDVALKAIAQAPVGDDAAEPAPAMIVILSDGTNTDGPDPSDAVDQAVDAEVPIYTIAYGTENGFVDLDGKRENVAPDPETMAEIAEATGGRSVEASSAEALDKAYQEIGSSVGYEEVKKPVTARYAFFALGFAIVAALGAVMMAARWPR